MAVKELHISDNIDDLVYVRSTDGYWGWRVDLLAEKLKGSLEKKFLLCRACGGLLREANVIIIERKQELRCFACNPFVVGFVQAYTPMNTNQDSVDKRIVSNALQNKLFDIMDL